MQQLIVYFHQLITSKEEIDVIYIDFCRAFDSVPHNVVKLWNMGISGTLWRWFEFYLSNRCQCVSVNDSLSRQLPVISGVPQGSILDPFSIIFSIYLTAMTYNQVHYFRVNHLADFTQNGHTKIPVG